MKENKLIGTRLPITYIIWISYKLESRLWREISTTSDMSSVQFSSVAQTCLTLCDPMNRSTPGLPVHHQLPEFPQTHVHRVGDAIQPSHPLSSSSPPAPNPFQHQSLFQWVSSLHEVAKILEFQPQHQSFQWTPTLMAESKENLKNLLMRVKEESEKAVLKTKY